MIYETKSSIYNKRSESNDNKHKFCSSEEEVVYNLNEDEKSFTVGKVAKKLLTYANCLLMVCPDNYTPWNWRYFGSQNV
jgi:hypothetical protein